MATTQEILDDAELAKNYITSATGLSDDYKRTYIRLINISTLATNGISAEEKIQMMTECIQLLAITQGMYLANIDKKIENAIVNANTKQCQECKAMSHAISAEKEKHDAQLIEQYKKQHHIEVKDTSKSKKENESQDDSWLSIIKGVVTKPYVYVLGCVIAISPHGEALLKMVLDYFGK